MHDKTISGFIAQQGAALDSFYGMPEGKTCPQEGTTFYDASFRISVALFWLFEGRHIRVDCRIYPIT
jgi:hypothetical protein